jgi:hypothetical protein
VKFTLEIEMRSDAMQDPSDVGRALDHIADELIQRRYRESAAILDLNGNTVGSWQFVDQPSPKEETLPIELDALSDPCSVCGLTAFYVIDNTPRCRRHVS